MIERISAMRKRHQEGGFTLIELLVVIIILGILAAVVVFAIGGVGDKGKTASYATDAKTIRTAQEAFCANNGRYATEAELVQQRYLSEASQYHFTDSAPSSNVIAFGNCTGSGDLSKAKFLLNCDSAEAGCGSGGALATGGKLVLPGSASVLGLNPAVNTIGNVQFAVSGLFLGLIELDAAGNPVPGLATEVPTVANGGITNGGKAFTFKLATAKWHDFATSGQFVKASDVKFSFEAALLRYHARALSSLRPALAQPCTDAPAVPDCPSIVANDSATPMTVTFNFANTYAPILAQLAHHDGAVIPKHIWPNCYTAGGACPTTATPWPAGQDPVGAGPFTYGKAGSPGLQGNGYHFFKNPYYAEFKPGLPVFDEVYQKFGVTNSLQELRNGTIDYTGLSGANVASLATTPDANIIRDTRTASSGGSTNCTLKLIYNLWNPGAPTTGVPNPSAVGTPGTVANVNNNTAAPHPMLGDLAVRKAIAKGIDRSTYINDIQSNDGSKLSTSPINSNMAWASGSNPIPAYDVSAANADLDAAGWTGRNANNIRQKTVNGVLLTMKLQFSGFAGQQVSVLTKMDQSLQSVGVDLDVVTDSLVVMNGRYENRDFDAHLFSNCQATDPDVGMSRLYKSTSINTAVFTNGAGYKNATVDTAFANAAAQLSQADRAPFYATVRTQLQADLPTLWLIESVVHKGYRRNCTGFQFWSGLYAEAANCTR